MTLRRPSLWLILLGTSGCYLFKSAEIETTCEDLAEGCDGGGGSGGTPDSGDTGDGGDTGDTGETTPPIDEDSDGYGVDVDCNDDDPSIHPGADETCATVGIDDDCDGLIDEDDDSLTDAVTYFLDGDNDGFGLDDRTTSACSPPPDYAEANGDCDDTKSEVNPDAIEVCDNATDDNCDGTADPCAWSGSVARTTAEGRWLSPGGVGFASTFDMDDLDGDGRHEAVLGVPYTGTSSQGAVFIMGRPPLTTVGSLATVADAVISGTDDYQNFGALARVLPDVTGDGVADLAVSDWNNQFFVFEGPIVTQDASRPYARMDTYAPTEGTGAMSADFTGDGVAELIVGLPYAYDPSSGDYLGTVAIHGGPLPASRTDTVDEADMVLRGPTSSDMFGYSLEHADFDGDGVPELIVTAPSMAPSGSATGFVGIYDTTATAVWDDAEAWFTGPFDSYFGYGVIAEDFDNDGTPDLLVSAPAEQVAPESFGAVYWFDALPSGESDSSTAVGRVSGTEYAYIGYAMDAADTDGNGVPGIAISAPYHFAENKGVVLGFHTAPYGGTDISAADYAVPSTADTSGYGAFLQLAPVVPSKPAGLFVYAEGDSMIEYLQGSGL